MKLNMLPHEQLPDVKILTVQPYEDNRGMYIESFNHDSLTELLGYRINFVQDSDICSYGGALRGLHFQIKEDQQFKLLRVLEGRIFDVFVDVRPESGTYGQWGSLYLSDLGKKQVLIPPGFAHGFLSLTSSIVTYKTDRHESKENSRTLKWDDPTVAIEWPQLPKFISTKDFQASAFGTWQ